jgi:hypothetical protein
MDDPKQSNEYLALLGDRLQGAEVSSPWAIAHLVRNAALSRSTALTSNDLITRSRKALAGQNGMAWFRAVLAIALYRAGEFAEAHEIARNLEEIANANTQPFSFGQKPYLCAIIAMAAGDQSEAQAHFVQAESLYRQICLEILARPAVDSGLPQPNWNELAYLQALRREAWSRMNSAAAPDDPWQHLIQSRGFQMIGEGERAHQENSKFGWPAHVWFLNGTVKKASPRPIGRRSSTSQAMTREPGSTGADGTSHAASRLKLTLISPGRFNSIRTIDFAGWSEPDSGAP